MDTRRAKQWIYGTLYGLILLGFFFGIYFSFARPAPSCEGGVDCGGVCAKVCLPADLKQISIVGNPTAFASSPGRYTFLAQVANSNAGFAARSFDYSFDLRDASGTVVQSFPGRSFIYGGEVKYLVAPNVPAALGGAAGGLASGSARLAIKSIAWTDAASLGVVPQFGNPLAVTGSAAGSSTIAVGGRITDSDAAAFTNILIVAIFYDTKGLAVGASQTVLDAIAPGETKDFSVAYPLVPNVSPAATKFYAYALRP